MRLTSGAVSVAGPIATSASVTWRKRIVVWHRWISLALAAVWFIQITTGVLLVFRWEIDDATVAGKVRPTDWWMIAQRVDGITQAQPSLQPQAIWTSGSGGERWDITFEDARTGAVTNWRVDGAGNVLRIADERDSFGPGTIFDTLLDLHYELSSGVTGFWIVALSGGVLCGSLMLGLKLAWPGRGQFRKIAFPPRALPAQMRFYRWHIAIGLWIAVPALVTSGSGVLLSFEDVLQKHLGVVPAAQTRPVDTHRPPIGLAEAVAIARRAYPGAAVSGIALPKPDSPYFRFRLWQGGEPKRTYGRTTIYLDAASGAQIGNFDAVAKGGIPRVVDALYPTHTGQILGAIGRVTIAATGLGMLIVLYLGVGRFLHRRSKKGRPRQP